MLALILSVGLYGTAAAQNTFRVGDTVVVPDGRTGKVEAFKDQDLVKVKFGENDSKYFLLKDVKEAVDPSAPVFRVGDRVAVKATNKEGVVESITDKRDGAKGKFGPGKYDFQWVFFKDLITPQAAALQRSREQDELKQKPIRAQFEDDAKPFASVITNFAHVYDSKYQIGFTVPDDPAAYEKSRKELEGLAVVCQKYPNLTNPPRAYADSISQNPADWCKMAEQRTSLIKKMQMKMGETYAKGEADLWKLKIAEAMRNDIGTIYDNLQMLLYDRPSWEQKNMEGSRKRYAYAGEKVPAEVFASLNEKVDELKARIEREAPARNWEKPEYADVALEAMVRRAFPAKYPGGQLLKTGMTYATWKSSDDTSLVGTVPGYKVYRTEIGKYRFKNGRMLIKLPNQPFCQSRDFTVEQTKTGGAYSGTKLNGFNDKGIFVKCP